MSETSADHKDHLKRVFDKSVCAAARSWPRLYFGQYEPRIAAGAPLGADGWFIDDEDH